MNKIEYVKKTRCSMRLTADEVKLLDFVRKYFGDASRKKAMHVCLHMVATELFKTLTAKKPEVPSDSTPTTGDASDPVQELQPPSVQGQE